MRAYVSYALLMAGLVCLAVLGTRPFGEMDPAPWKCGALVFMLAWLLFPSDEPWISVEFKGGRKEGMMSEQGWFCMGLAAMGLSAFAVILLGLATLGAL